MIQATIVAIKGIGPPISGVPVGVLLCRCVKARTGGVRVRVWVGLRVRVGLRLGARAR